MSVEVHPQYLVDDSGERTSVLLSIEEFESLMQFVTEDEEDLLADAEALDRALLSQPDFKPWRQMRDDIEARHNK
jgi:hypothetical protein